MANYENIKIKKDEGVFWIILNRPKTRNALDEIMIRELTKAFEVAENDESIRVILFHGAGGKSFAAGADINQLHKRKPAEALLPGLQGLYSTIEKSTKATIAVIQGYALGGGCELALACDIRMATENSLIGLPELNLGIIPGAGGTQRLARIVGKGRALNMILTGHLIKGKEAERIGLVSYVTTEQHIQTKAYEVAKQIINKGPIAIKLAKYAIHKGYDIDIETALWIEKLSQAYAFGTEDKQEGTKAFLEKRNAIFKNK